MLFLKDQSITTSAIQLMFQVTKISGVTDEVKMTNLFLLVEQKKSMEDDNKGLKNLQWEIF